MDELYEHLLEQVTFLRRSARAFDEGDTLEAKRLVTPIRVLVHETPRSRGRALLSQLNVIGHMTFLNTAATIDPMDLILSKSLLTVTRIGPQTEPEPRITYIAPLEKFFPGAGAGEWRPFEPWWNQTVVRDSHGTTFSRRDLVLAVAHKDGVMHVDELEESYRRLSRSNSLGWVVTSNGGERRPINNPVLPTIRQIAFELDQSLSQAFPEVVSKP